MLMDSREALKTTTKSSSGMMTSFCALNPSAAVHSMTRSSLNE